MATPRVGLCLGAGVQLTCGAALTTPSGHRLDATLADAAAPPQAGAVRGTVTRIDGRTFEASTSWGSFTCDTAAITAHGFGPPGTCVLWAGGRTGTLLGWRDGAHLVREGLIDVEVPTLGIERAVPAARGLEVRTLFGDGTASAVDATTSVVALDWGATLTSPHSSNTVRCPAANALPVVRCVARTTQTMVARSLEALKALTAKVPSQTRQRLSDRLNDVDGTLDSVEASLSNAPRLLSHALDDDLRKRASAGFVGGDVTALSSVASAATDKLRQASHIDAVLAETSDVVADLRDSDAAVQAYESSEQVAQAASDVSHAASSSKAALKLSAETAKLSDSLAHESSRGALGALQRTKIDDAGVRQKASEVATKVLASKLLDGALFESAFSDALSSATHTDVRSVVAPVARACADFAKSWLDEASQVGFSKLPPEVAITALQDGITAAADAALCSENELARRGLLEVSIAADCYDGLLTKASLESGDGLTKRAAKYALDCSQTTELLGDAAPVLRRALENISDTGDVAQAVQQALDGDLAVDSVGELGKFGASALDALKTLNRDERVLYFAKMAAHDDAVSGVLESIQTLDAESAVREAENLAQDSAARDAFVKRVNDAALAFLLRHLPAMPVPPIDEKNDNLRYKVENLNLTNLKISEEDVTVEVASSINDPTALFALKATKIQARFEELQWSVAQLSFPYLEVEGRADVVVMDAQVSLALAARRAPGEQGGLELKVALTKCDVKIASLDLTMEEHGLSWVFNALASLLTDYVRDYVCASIEELLRERSQYLLEPVNALLKASWAPLARALHLPDVADLPPLQAEADDIEAIDVVLRETGSLGIALEERVKDSQPALVIGSLDSKGQAKPCVAQLGLSGEDVKGAVLIAIDGAVCQGLTRDDIVRRVTNTARPRTLRFRLRGEAALRRRAAARAVDTLELFPAGAPRDLEPLGLRLKTHATCRNACAIAALVRGAKDEVLAAERSGVVRGALLCACTGRPRLWVAKGDATPQLVGKEVMAAAKLAASKGEAFSVTLAPSMDRQLDPNGGFPLAVDAGRFYARPGAQLVSVGGALILPNAPPKLVADKLAHAERCVLRDAYRFEYLAKLFMQE